MASKENHEKSLTQKEEIKKEATVEAEGASSESMNKKSSILLEKEDSVVGRHTESTPEKSNEENMDIAEIVKEKEEEKELESPIGANKDEGMGSFESKCSRIRMEDFRRKSSSMELTPPVVATTHQRDSMNDRSSSNLWNVAVPRRAGTISRALPNFDEPALVLATHLVPSLPIVLFEIVAEIIETVTGRPVVLLHESRTDRSVAKKIVDIAFLPAGDDEWAAGCILPVSFVFKHRLNTAKKPDVYVDVVVARDCSRKVEKITDLRGYRCALPDRSKSRGAAALLFKHLSLKGENPSFFGNTLDSGSQLSALQMVAGKQTDIAVVESPVITCHKKTLHGIDSVCVVESLGPLPPYRIMLNGKMKASIRQKIKEGLLSAACDQTWMEKLGEFGVLGFAEYEVDRYGQDSFQFVMTRVRYY